jgi:DNA replication protein DnaC
VAFLIEAADAVLIGPSGVGKSSITRNNIAHQAVLAGQTLLCTSNKRMLNELAGAASNAPRAGPNPTRSDVHAQEHPMYPCPPCRPE